jgi:hypothetical protein
MNEYSDNQPQVRPATTNIPHNVSYLVLSILPLFFTCLALRAFAPLDGFCPLDIFRFHQSPSPHDLLWWRYASSAAYVALAIAGIFKRPFAIATLVVTLMSPTLLVVRFVIGFHPE